MSEKIKSMDASITDNLNLLNSRQLETDNNAIKDQELKILLNEYNLCCSRIEDFINRQDSILQISLAIIGAVIAFTLLNVIPQELYIAVPLIPFIILIHVLYHLSRAITNQGYRKYLEEIINTKIPKNESIKYYKVGKEFMLEKNPSSKINSVIFPLIFLLSILYSIFMSDFNLTVIGGASIYVIITVYAGLNINNYLKKLDEKVYNFCKDNVNIITCLFFFVISNFSFSFC